MCCNARPPRVIASPSASICFISSGSADSNAPVASASVVPWIPDLAYSTELERMLSIVLPPRDRILALSAEPSAVLPSVSKVFPSGATLRASATSRTNVGICSPSFVPLNKLLAAVPPNAPVKIPVIGDSPDTEYPASPPNTGGATFPRIPVAFSVIGLNDRIASSTFVAPRATDSAR